MTAKLILNSGRDKSLRRKHPWIFSKAVKTVVGDPQLGETIDVFDHKNNFIAKAAYSPSSQIRARVWDFHQDTIIDVPFFINKIQRAEKVRRPLIERDGLTGYRLIAGEADGLPGVTIDVFANVIVCQLLSAGAEVHRETILDAIIELYPNAIVYERSDVSVRKKEGLKERKGLLHGDLTSSEVTIEENGIKLLVDVVRGHKTGFYLDQRNNRKIAGELAKDKTVLNCFCYTGTFATYAIKAGAKHVTNVDVSDYALNMGKKNLEINELDLSKADFINADVFKLLRQYKEEGKTFDMIILDPPKFADSKSQLQGACRGYKDINMLAMSLINEGGYLLTFSCSGLMEPSLFQKIVADAALDANKDVYFTQKLQQAEDHPVSGAYPESFYLKGLVCQVFSS
ncbi:class I SAM-dependent methyltransferase [Flocculibacter collagenilyticus]|uniref:class I SAM-dependent methyltransferase n=1 Tax=Flocculibacter collagenilyticus TaxID=2744479 RepID=UPI0018F38A8F|nr:class I SAM-dependent methyltransferase [Flocculibacter collagenilyticus]